MAVDNASLYREASKSSAELKAILAQMADAVMVADASGIVTFANEAALRIFGPVAIGEPVSGSRRNSELLTMDGAYLDDDDMVLNRSVKGEQVMQSHWKVRRGGQELVLETSAVPLRAPDGSSLGAVTVSRDITVQYDLDRQKDDFLLAASHDLKSPLTLIKGTAQLLLQQAQRAGIHDDQLTAGLKKIDATGTRMSEMVDEMLDVTRLQMGRPLSLYPKRIDLVALTKRVVDEIRASSERNPIVVESDPAEVIGTWDPLRAERVILNLLGNADKFSTPGRPIRVTISRVEESDGAWAVLSVTDRGVGIPVQDLPHVFEQFRRGRNVAGTIAGSGIGLAGVKQIVEQHGGTIAVESTENQGSTFTVRLPMERSLTPDGELGAPSVSAARQIPSDGR